MQPCWRWQAGDLRVSACDMRLSPCERGERCHSPICFEENVQETPTFISGPGALMPLGVRLWVPSLSLKLPVVFAGRFCGLAARLLRWDARLHAMALYVFEWKCSPHGMFNPFSFHRTFSLSYTELAFRCAHHTSGPNVVTPPSPGIDQRCRAVVAVLSV